MNSSRIDDHLWAVILAGGVGSRFWPVSTPERPKQFLPLGGEDPLLTETVRRIEPLVPLERLRILTGENLRTPSLRAVPELTEENLLVEPTARGTAPALAWAAAEIVESDPDAVMISLHADHMIEPASEFLQRLRAVASAAAEDDRLYTIGVVPTRPETGYGYIMVGDQLRGEPELFEVADFVEKPDPDTAHEYLLRGGHLWNSGIFVWRAEALLTQLAKHTPEIGKHLGLIADGKVDTFFGTIPDLSIVEGLLERSDRVSDASATFVWADIGSWYAVVRTRPDLSIDEGLLERSDRVSVARATFEWDDIGPWDAVARTRPADQDGNVVVGQGYLIDSEGCIAWADDGQIVVFGAEDLVVVRSGEVTFVAPREKTAELKKLLADLPEELTNPERS